MSEMNIIEELDGPNKPVDIFPKRSARKPVKQRKAKVSRVATDYDPFAEMTAAPLGFQRPKQKCWVSESIARPIELSELSPLWRQDPGKMGTSDRRHRFLASVVAKVNGDYFVRRKHNGMWVAKKTAAEVRSILWNEWGAGETDLNIRKETIKDFMSEDSFLVLEQLAYIPGAGSFVEYKGNKCLNSHYQQQLPYREDAMDGHETRLLMDVIVRNLLGHSDGDFEDWLAAIEDDKPTSVRWLFHWLAALYQRPGHAQSTVLWLIGPKQGVGKGLFTSGLSTLLGEANVKLASAEEFKSDWSDSLMNASLFILDEIDFSSRKEANNKLKRLVGNAAMTVRKRNVGEIEIPSVASFVFTTNSIHPLALDRDDRRNTFFETVGSDQAKARAARFGALSAEEQRRGWEGLAELLSLVEIDEAFIRKAFHTEAKQRMISANLDPFDEWFSLDQTLEAWRHGEFAPVDWIKKNYLSWAKDNAFQGCATSAFCMKKLNELSAEGAVSDKLRKTLHDGSKPHGYVRIDPRVGDSVLSAKDCNPIAAYSPRLSRARIKNTAIMQSRSEAKTVKALH